MPIRALHCPAMATVTIDDPEMVVTKKIDQSGKAYVTNSLADEEVRIVVERIEESEECQ